MSKEIQLSQGKVAIVDDDDFEQISKHKWYFNHGYAVRMALKQKNPRIQIRMHNEIIGKREGLEIDHINGDCLDNRKANLRFVTHGQNIHNSRAYGKTSKYKGVYWDKKSHKWHTKIAVNYKQIHVGLFNSELEAAIAYDKKAIELHGEYAWTNKASNHAGFADYKG